jgi:hypothetical protein
MADNFLKKAQYTKMESQRCNIILYWKFGYQKIEYDLLVSCVEMMVYPSVSQ